MKKIILTESDIHFLVKECVCRIIESKDYIPYDPIKKKEEEDASWDSWENTYSPHNGSLHTYLDDSLIDSNDFDFYEFYKDEKNYNKEPKDFCWTKSQNFSKDFNPGFYGMNALDTENPNTDFARNSEYFTK